MYIDSYLSIDDEIQKYISEIPNYGYKMIIRHILDLTYQFLLIKDVPARMPAMWRVSSG